MALALIGQALVAIVLIVFEVLFWRAEAGTRPGGRPPFLCATRKEAPIRAPQSAAPAGQTCVGVLAGGAVELTARLRRSVRTTTASQITKHARSDAHATPQAPRRRRSQQGVEHPQTTRAQAPRAGTPGRAQRWPVWLLGATPLSGCACGAQGMADQGSRLSERRRREFERDPASTEHRRLPGAKRRDADSRVAFLLLTFLWRSVWTGDIVNRCADTWFTDLIKRPRCQPGQLPSSDGVRRTPQSSRPCPAWAGYPPCGDAGHCSACIACP